MLYLHALGHFHPENVIDNAFLESLDIGTDDEWITSRVGIRRRRTVLPLDYIRDTQNRDVRLAAGAALYRNAETGARAARMALSRAGLAPSDVGLVLCGGCAPETQIPAEAAAVACELGIEKPALDLHSACSTFGAQLHFVAQLGDAAPDYVLCVQIENLTKVTDYGDRSSAILFGDASSAAVVSNRHVGRARLVHSEHGCAPSGAWDVVIPRAGYFRQNGSKVQKFAIKQMGALYRDCRARADGADPVFVGHQANLTMLESVVRRSGIAEGRHWFNIDEYGNQGAAGAPAVLSQRWDTLPRGELVSVVVVGSGLSWSSLLFAF